MVLSVQDSWIPVFLCHPSEGKMHHQSNVWRGWKWWRTMNSPPLVQDAQSFLLVQHLRDIPQCPETTNMTCNVKCTVICCVFHTLKHKLLPIDDYGMIINPQLLRDPQDLLADPLDLVGPGLPGEDSNREIRMTFLLAHGHRMNLLLSLWQFTVQLRSDSHKNKSCSLEILFSL